MCTQRDLLIARRYQLVAKRYQSSKRDSVQCFQGILDSLLYYLDRPVESDERCSQSVIGAATPTCKRVSARSPNGTIALASEGRVSVPARVTHARGGSGFHLDNVRILGAASHDDLREPIEGQRVAALSKRGAFEQRA